METRDADWRIAEWSEGKARSKLTPMRYFTDKSDVKIHGYYRREVSKL
jgi:hypothetical protein